MPTRRTTTGVSRPSPRNPARLRPIRRNPAELGSLDLFAALDTPGALTELISAQRVDDVVAKVREGLATSLANQRRVGGWHVQQMFAQVTQSLNEVALLTEEDQGNTWVQGGEGVQPPDFRVVLTDGTRLLVEVKKRYERQLDATFEIRNKDLDALTRYAELAGDRLVFAIYWAAAGLWTLSDPRRMTRGAKRSTTTFTSAMMANEMALLGDYMIWTKPPLALVLEFDEDTSQWPSEDGARSRTGQATIRQAFFEAAGERVMSKRDTSLTWCLMNYGDWHEETRSLFEGDTLKRVSFEFAPQDRVPGQQIESVGYLSQIISNAFVEATSKDGQVRSLSATLEQVAEVFEGVRDHGSEQLHLVRLVLQLPHPIPSDGEPVDV